jgi:hypothetical protein
MEEGDEDLWLLWLAYEHNSSTFLSIKSKICGIKHNFKLKYGFDPFKMNMRGDTVCFHKFERAFRQIKRLDADRVKKEKFSVTRFVLLEIEKLVDRNNFEQVVIWTICVVGVSCLLRWSEITHSGKKGANKKLLKLSNLSRGLKTMWLRLKDTKTKLFGDSMAVDFRKDDSKVCPWGTMEEWLKIRPKSSKWLFCSEKGEPMRTKKVQTQLKLWLNQLGNTKVQLDGGISLRKGGALTMALCGVPDRVIRAYGRWRSYAYRIYIDLTDTEKEMWKEVMASKLTEEGAKFFTDKASKRGSGIVERLMDN